MTPPYGAIFGDPSARFERSRWPGKLIPACPARGRHLAKRATSEGMKVENMTPADVAPICNHIRDARQSEWATVTIAIHESAGPPHGGHVYTRTVCPYCAGVAMGCWTGPGER